jgi:hypothetical protein
MMPVGSVGGPAEGGLMLAEHPVDVMLTATDLVEVKQFYGDRIGLEVLIESDEFVTFRCGGDSRLVVTRSSVRSGEQQTKASWRVADLAAEVAELRGRGVEVVDYDEPGLTTVNGVADVGFALAAWFVDPGGNTIGLLGSLPLVGLQPTHIDRAYRRIEDANRRKAAEGKRTTGPATIERVHATLKNALGDAVDRHLSHSTRRAASNSPNTPTGSRAVGSRRGRDVPRRGGIGPARGDVGADRVARPAPRRGMRLRVARPGRGAQNPHGDAAITGDAGNIGVWAPKTRSGKRKSTSTGRRSGPCSNTGSGRTPNGSSSAPAGTTAPCRTNTASPSSCPG